MDSPVPLSFPSKYRFIFKIGKNRIAQLRYRSQSESRLATETFKEGRYSGDVLTIGKLRVLISKSKYSDLPNGIDDLLVRQESGHLRWSEGIEKKHLELTDIANNVADALDSWNGHFVFREEQTLPSGDVKPGLRPPQIGAIHAALAHWKVSNAVATVVMPTGTGKTDTMIALLAHTRPSCLLVVVPNDALRTQIALKFSELGVLQLNGSFPYDVSYPVVGTLKEHLENGNAIDKFFRTCNVVVTTMPLLSHFSALEQERVAQNCSHLFIDEAHHTPAPTWRRLKRAFEKKSILQFTATPFRNDGQHIDGRVIFEYPLLQAQQEKYFRNINLLEVWDPINPDRTIATAAIARLRADIKSGFDHTLMARARSIDRANDLLKIYEELGSEFYPQVVHSELPRTIIDERIALLRSKKSRIAVSVAMFGEGFDFPGLKVAALHDIHQSLAVTIQFTGRFTRTDQNVGDATVVVNLADQRVDDSVKELYAQNPDWNVLLRKLTEGANERQKAKQQFFDSFDKLQHTVPIQNIRPKMSTVVYATSKANWKPWKIEDVISGEQLVGKLAISMAEGIAYFVAREEEEVPWASIKELRNFAFQLYAFHWDKDRRLLFINSSNMDREFDDFANAALGGDAKLLKGGQVFRALSGIKRLLLRNMGLSDRIRRSVRFTMLSGDDVESGISGAQSHGRDKTHLFGDGYDGENHVTVGCSKKGRIWSWAVAPDLLQWKRWCGGIGSKLVDSSIDPDSFLKDSMVPEVLTARPQLFPLAILWPDEFYDRPEDAINIAIRGAMVPMFDVGIELIERDESGPIRFKLQSEENTYRYHINYSEEGVTYIPDDADLTIRVGSKSSKMSELFARWHPVVRFEQDAFSRGDQLLRPRQRKLTIFDTNRIVVLDWASIDLTKESQGLEKAPDSIQRHVISHITSSEWPSNYSIVFDDDAPGEAADIVALSIQSTDLCVDLFHCKFSKAKTGKRVKDLYEVCGQAQKSIKWRENPARLLSHMLKRETSRLKRWNVTRFEQGDAKGLQEIRYQVRTLRPVFRVFVVQPGVSKSGVTDDQKELLASTQLYLSETVGIEFNVICSS